MSPFLMIVAIEVLIVLCGVSSHFIWLLEKWFILNFLQNLTDRFSKHCINYWGNNLPYIIPSQPIVIIPVRPEIPHLLRDNLNLTFPLLLVFLSPLVFINPVYELAHNGNRFARQRLP